MEGRKIKMCEFEGCKKESTKLMTINDSQGKFQKTILVCIDHYNNIVSVEQEYSMGCLSNEKMVVNFNILEEAIRIKDETICKLVNAFVCLQDELKKEKEINIKLKEGKNETNNSKDVG
jgi:hypothetical protein